MSTPFLVAPVGTVAFGSGTYGAGPYGPSTGGPSPGKVLDPTPGSRRFWLGTPGKMIQLPAPSIGYSADPSRGEVEHQTASGGSTVTLLHGVKRRWVLTWPRLYGRDWQVVGGFYRRLFGYGPWCFVSPEDVNRLTDAQSMCSGLNGVVEGWAPTVGTLSVDASLAPVQPSGVLRWTGAGVGSLLTASTAAAVPDVSSGAPYLPSEPATFSLWVSTVTGTASVSVVLRGCQPDGTVTRDLTGPATTISTTPVLLGVTDAPGAWSTSQFLLPMLKCNTAAAPPILISVAQLEYWSQATDWQVGSGVPRVTWPVMASRSLDASGASSATMTLAEC